jgi:ribosomal protein S12 methylthiotransferase accessory factor
VFNTTHTYKDSAPQATVARIKSILDAHGISVTEVWQEAVVPGCNAVSIRVNGSMMRTNGKGKTRELAMASGYGELMERLQLGLTGNTLMQKSTINTTDSRDSKQSAAALFAQAPHHYRRMTQWLHTATGINMAPETILPRFADADGMVAVREYIRPENGEPIYLPTALIQRLYGTNGCAAGNTMEEALVQAISEVMERHHQLRIVHEDLTPPDIPEEVLAGFPGVYRTICYLRSNGFQVRVKDCSFGTGFPVVCLCLIREDTGYYHTHFGAFPVLEVALERTLTEAFQGRTLENVAQFHHFTQKKPGEHSLQVIANEVSFGSWEKSAIFFASTPSYSFDPNLGLEGKDNKALLKACLSFLSRQGLEVLVRDYSVLGFPTYQVIIPGFSEVMIHRLHLPLDDSRYSADAAKVLRDPTQATLPEYMSLLLHLQNLHSMGSKIRDAKGFTACARLSAELDRITSQRLMISTLCYIHYAMGRYDEVMQGTEQLIQLTDGESKQQLLCLQQFFQLKQTNCDRDTLGLTLRSHHSSETIAWLNAQLRAKSNPFAGMVLRCDEIHCAECPIQPQCRQAYTSTLSTLIRNKGRELDTHSFATALQQLLQ